MSSSLLHITDEEVKKHVTWDLLVAAIEQVLSDTSNGKVIQPQRTFLSIPEKNGLLLTMPGMSSDALGCKLVTAFQDNQTKYNVPSIMATILLFSSDTGALEAVLDGGTITEWRTAAASVVAAEALSTVNRFEHLTTRLTPVSILKVVITTVRL